MKQQNDWYTGIEYNYNELEKDILVERIRLEERTPSQFHEQVELYYIFSGAADMEINGGIYPVSGGSLICLYTHHFYRFTQIREPVEALRVSFHIGLFMYMSWERHPQHANRALVYDTCPVVNLQGEEQRRIEWLAGDILTEERDRRFESRNMIAYKTLELHAYHCRYAFEAIGKDRNTRENGTIPEKQVWKVIMRVILSSSEDFSLEEMAGDCGCKAAVLNRRIKDACGYTFHQLQQMGKSINACALLHFPELDIPYISDMLGYSSKQAFYRSFSQHCHMTPAQYRSRLWGDEEGSMWASSTAIRFLQYMHLHFYEELSIKSLSDRFFMKEYTVAAVFQNAFGMSFGELLGQIRVSYACAFLRSTEQTVLGISSLCGFESLSTFQRVFRRWMGQTPGEYRAAMRVKIKTE